MQQRTKDILKAIAIIVFVPTVLTVGYYGGKKVIQFVNKKKAEKASKDEVKASENKEEKQNGDKSEQV